MFTSVHFFVVNKVIFIQPGDYRGIMHSNGTGKGVNTLRMVVGRGDLANKGLTCTVSNQALNEPRKLRLGLNVNGKLETIIIV